MEPVSDCNARRPSWTSGILSDLLAPGSHDIPPELFEADRVVPDFRQMTDSIAVEIHNVDVIGLDAFAGRRDGTTCSRVSATEYPVGRHVLAPFIHPE